MNFCAVVVTWSGAACVTRGARYSFIFARVMIIIIITQFTLRADDEQTKNAHRLVFVRCRRELKRCSKSIKRIFISWWHKFMKAIVFLVNLAPTFARRFILICRFRFNSKDGSKFSPQTTSSWFPPNSSYFYPASSQPQMEDSIGDVRNVELLWIPRVILNDSLGGRIFSERVYLWQMPDCSGVVRGAAYCVAAGRGMTPACGLRKTDDDDDDVGYMMRAYWRCYVHKNWCARRSWLSVGHVRE